MQESSNEKENDLEKEPTSKIKNFQQLSSSQSESTTMSTPESNPQISIANTTPQTTSIAIANSNREKSRDSGSPANATVTTGSSTGWSSWSSWITAASNTITQSVDQYVKPTVSSITETTTQFVKDIVSDEPVLPQFPSNSNLQSTATSSSTSTGTLPSNNSLNNAAENMGNSEILPPDSSGNSGSSGNENGESVDLLAAVDKGFSLFESSVDKLGSYLNQGFQKVTSNSVEYSTVAKSIATNSFQKVKQVASSTTQHASQLTEKIAFQSVDALESVGKTALSLLTVQEVVENKRRIRPRFHYIPQVTQMTKEEQLSFEQNLNRNYFEENNGSAHLQELEKISITCTLKMQKLDHKLLPQSKDQLNALLQAVKDLFDNDPENSEKFSDSTDVELNELASKHQQLIDAFSKSSHRQASDIVNNFTRELEELNPDKTASSIITATDICHLCASSIDKGLMECVQRISQFSASSVEQILRIVESILIELDSNKLNKEESMKRIKFVFYVSIMLANELSNISTAFITGIKAACEEGNKLFLDYSKKGENETAEGSKCAEDIDIKMNLLLNQIYLDTSNAISNIEECRKFLFPICKFVVANASDLQVEVEPAVH